MSEEFDRRRNAPFPDAGPLDREALRYATSWHRYPPIHDAVWYRGINLGEVAEYHLLPELITALLEREARDTK